MTIAGKTGAAAYKSRAASQSPTLWGNRIGRIYKGSPKSGNNSGRDLLWGFRLEGFTEVVNAALKVFFQDCLVPPEVKEKAPRSVLADQIPVILLYDEPDQNFQTYMGAFPNGKCAIVCDGETISYERTGEGKNSRLSPTSKPCACKEYGHCLEVSNNRGVEQISCSAHGKLKLVIREFPVAGYFELATGGNYDMESINDCLYRAYGFLQGYGKGLRDVPLTLYRSDEKVIADSKRRNIGLVSLRLDDRYAAAIMQTSYAAAMLSARSPQLALPQGGDMPQYLEAEVVTLEPDYGLPADVSYKDTDAWQRFKIAASAARTIEQLNSAVQSARDTFPPHAAGAIKALADREADRIAMSPPPAPKEVHPNQRLLADIRDVFFAGKEQGNDAVKAAIAACCKGVAAKDMSAEQIACVFSSLCVSYAVGLSVDPVAIDEQLGEPKGETYCDKARDWVAIVSDYLVKN